MTITEQIAALDTSLFATVESQTSDQDRKSLLAIHDALASRLGNFSYLEIGSHLGGTLQAVLADPRCSKVVSIDPRPEWQPDDRPETDGFTYENNSTTRMRDLLGDVPDADLSKLQTVEKSTSELTGESFGHIDFCFIDGEHTYEAALRDALFCRAALDGVGVIAFHDYEIIASAVLEFLRRTSLPCRACSLRSGVFVVELGRVPTLLDHLGVRRQLRRPQRAWVAANRIGAGSWITALDVRRRRGSRGPGRA